MAKGTVSPWVGSLVLPLGVWVSWEKSLALSASSVGKQVYDLRTWMVRMLGR